MMSTYPVYISGTQQKAAGGILWRSHVRIAVEVDGSDVGDCANLLA
jgi:hypothetical protein